MGTAQQNIKYDLLWIVGGQVKEVLDRNKPKTLMLWLKKQKENSTHKSGKLVLMENGTHKH